MTIDNNDNNNYFIYFLILHVNFSLLTINFIFNATFVLIVFSIFIFIIIINIIFQN